MSVKKKVNEIDVKEVKEVKVVKLPTRQYEVIIDWQVGSKLYKKGDKIALTEQGYTFYKKQFKVK